ncbi:hypothetical protein PHYSODRAFT_299032 [Phytophthora sojae]|uniref:RxLR effector PexRD54 WY domain-containing protein n=1 Tax=Phytophthora sojae (strain P6497) TaxID=1094619 RepID=G4ZA55_PHYSP|nr:hypothetical protein PHYSODRAFT_299032 [Phytophthora sojae]EGZ21194.1 hypothetical protein PHYSODRAFT_299032 [Phytophthora sojae]|eukprot:XP_009523911.1 hypothetical protein PHYSODRAFT_299032 [Phytophthora sojae]
MYCTYSAVVGDASALAYYPDQARISANPRQLNTGEKIEEARVSRAIKIDIKDASERAYTPGLSPLAGAVSKISPSAQKVANKLWLKSQTDPTLVFNMLHLGEASVKLDENPRFLLWLNYVDTGQDKLKDNSKFLQWFQYSKTYWSTVSRDPSDLQTFNSLLNKYKYSEIELVRLFQALKQRPELATLGDNLPTFLFKKWLDKKFTPRYVGKQLALPWGTTIFALEKDHIFYRALEEYTIYYTARRGGEELLKTVRGLFASNKPDEALDAAMKLAR